MMNGKRCKFSTKQIVNEPVPGYPFPMTATRKEKTIAHVGTFQMWFQEGGFERDDGYLEGQVDVGAIIVDDEGKVYKVWEIEKIVFEV